MCTVPAPLLNFLALSMELLQSKTHYTNIIKQLCTYQQHRDAEMYELKRV